MHMWDLLHLVLLCVGNATVFVIYSDSFTKAAKMEILNVIELWPKAAIADIPQNRCS